MSREHGPIGLAIEWSPRGVVAYDTTTRSTKIGDDIASLGLSGREAVLALSRRGVFVRTARVPNASPNEIRTILTMQAGELFPVPTVDLAWDFVLTDDITPDGRLAVLAAIPCGDLRRILEAAAAAGVKVRAAVPLAFGSTIIVQELGLTEAALVEQADDGPAVDIVSAGSLRASRATPPGMPLELEVTRALGLAGMESAPVVAAGEASVAGAIRETERTALQALAETAFDRLKLQLELPEAVSARTTAAARRSVRTALMAAVAAGMVALLVASERMDAIQVAKASETKSNARVQKLKNESKKVSSDRDGQVAIKESLDLAFSPAQKFSDILSVATAAVPKGVWLNAIALERGKPLTLRGTAKGDGLLADLVRQLDKNPDGRFRDVNFTNANTTLVNKVPVTVFVVSAFPVGNLPFLARAGASNAK